MPGSREREGAASRLRRVLSHDAAAGPLALSVDDVRLVLAVCDRAAELVHALDAYGGSAEIGPYVDRLDSALSAVADLPEGAGAASEAPDAAPGLLARPNGQNAP